MHLLIDGKNLLYRGIYASLNTDTKDHFVAISRMIHSYFHKFENGTVHVFWDDAKENLWRRDIHPEYKEADCRDKSSEIEQKLIKYQSICEEVWQNMNIRQYKRDKMEADDLIYTFCHTIPGRKVVVSSDGDMLQLSYRFDNVKIYNPSKKKICERPIIDPVAFKCLDGDTSDNIIGYYGIGPKKAAQHVANHDLMWKLLSERGIEIYHKNRRLIDLSLCPYLADNIIYVLEAINQPTKFNKKILVELLYNKHKIKGIMTEYKTIISSFNRVEDNDGSSCGVCQADASGE